jgi:hypothetical protein
MSVMPGCGDDDQSPGQDGGRDAGGGSGRGGAAGADAGRADLNAGGGGSSGATSDAGPDRTDGRGGADVVPDAPDGRSAGDASIDGDGPGIADSAVDLRDEDGHVLVDVSNDGHDAPANDGDGAVDATDEREASTSHADSADAVEGGDASAEDTGNDGDAADGGDASSFDVFDAPSCEDGNAATFDFYHPSYGCGHKYDANPGDADAWIRYDAGFHVDVATGLGWALPAGSHNAAGAAAACDAFSVAGLTSWRMPTIDEARMLAGGCAPTASGGSCPLSDPSCLLQSCGWASPACDSCTASGGPNSGQYCKADVAICTFFHTSSVCGDCSDAATTDWVYIPINGNFYPFSSATSIPTACVSIVPNGVPPSDGG